MSWDSDQVYECNLATMTCTCGDYLVYREVFAPDDPLRACKHLRMLLAEEEAVVLSEPDALPFWENRGGKLFKWNAPQGRTVFVSVDPTREGLRVASIDPKKPEDDLDHDWSVSDRSWSCGCSPRGVARAIRPALDFLSAYHAAYLEMLGSSVLKRWEENQRAQEERDRQAEIAREQREAEEHEAARIVGLCCGVCGAPLGHPWGSPIGTELLCGNCGFPNLVVGDERADAKEKALIDWKYYDDPRPAGGERLLSARKRRFEVELSDLQVRHEAGSISSESFIAERNRIHNEFASQFNALHAKRHEELFDIRRRIQNARRRLKRRAERQQSE